MHPLRYLRDLVSNQRAMMKLTAAVAACAAVGHEEPQTIIFNDEYRVVCPRCGAQVDHE